MPTYIQKGTFNTLLTSVCRVRKGETYFGDGCFKVQQQFALWTCLVFNNAVCMSIFLYRSGYTHLLGLSSKAYLKMYSYIEHTFFKCSMVCLWMVFHSSCWCFMVCFFDGFSIELLMFHGAFFDGFSLQLLVFHGVSLDGFSLELLVFHSVSLDVSLTWAIACHTKTHLVPYNMYLKVPKCEIFDPFFLHQ